MQDFVKIAAIHNSIQQEMYRKDSIGIVDLNVVCHLIESGIATLPPPHKV